MASRAATGGPRRPRSRGRTPKRSRRGPDAPRSSRESPRAAAAWPARCRSCTRRTTSTSAAARHAPPDGRQCPHHRQSGSMRSTRRSASTKAKPRVLRAQGPGSFLHRSRDSSRGSNRRPRPGGLRQQAVDEVAADEASRAGDNDARCAAGRSFLRSFVHMTGNCSRGVCRRPAARLDRGCRPLS